MFIALVKSLNYNQFGDVYAINYFDFTLNNWEEGLSLKLLYS